MPPPAVEFRDVSRVYTTGWPLGRTIQAVRSVSFRVEPGEVFGLLGPNRAGKTTLVKMLLSLCRPTAGTVVRLGAPAADRRTLARTGYMHENHAFPRYLNARQLLHCYGALTLIPDATLRPRVDELLALVGLPDRDDPIANFSKGMVQRLGLAQALLGEPDLLVLDEPTEGLDLEARRLLREVAVRQRARGRTVLVVSHVLPEVEQVCDRVAVLNRGELAYLGTTAELLRQGGGEGRSLEEALAELYGRTPAVVPSRMMPGPQDAKGVGALPPAAVGREPARPT